MWILHQTFSRSSGMGNQARIYWKTFRGPGPRRFPSTRKLCKTLYFLRLTKNHLKSFKCNRCERKNWFWLQPRKTREGEGGRIRARCSDDLICWQFNRAYPSVSGIWMASAVKSLPLFIRQNAPSALCAVPDKLSSSFEVALEMAK